MTTVEETSIRYVVFLEEVRGNRVAKVAFPAQALYLRYLKKRGLRPREARCSYVELPGDELSELQACYCQWLPEGKWELSGFTADETLPNFPMEPYAYRQVRITVAGEDYLAQLENRTQKTVAKIARRLSRPIQALDFDLLKELRAVPKAYYLALFLVMLAVLTFFQARTTVPDFYEERETVGWLSPAMRNVSYFEGEGRLVFEGEMDPVAVQRAFRGLDVIPPEDEYRVSRYLLYRDGGDAALGVESFGFTGDEYQQWMDRYFITIRYGYAGRAPNGSVLAYNLVTNRLYGNLSSRADLDYFR